MHEVDHGPLGLFLARTAKEVGRAMDEAMSAVGGSVPVWQVLLTVKTKDIGTQRELASAVGIQCATLTHHLNTMEDDGLLTRRRAPGNRRTHEVVLTQRGEDLFARLREVVTGFEGRLGDGLSAGETAVLVRLLDRLRANVSTVTVSSVDLATVTAADTPSADDSGSGVLAADAQGADVSSAGASGANAQAQASATRVSHRT
ncbi:MarR family winged helix-turn-helix transcriptional regulator [Actinokineospora terrae]|uniref:MarR family transcriptional regulator, transcriptional regulator for hemolysin n=1 Tax=Actinokineospora terrae TaxID=155974 RepID=A0A1H9L8E6_9PSEU|nr:MarR family transcriptional regulator, transcriptional regulator for hemolysin [Actinokineospora terrae]